MGKHELETLLQDAENELELVRFAMVQALQFPTVVEGEPCTPAATYAIEGEYLNVLAGCENVIWNLCDRIHEALMAC